jgi:mono/diheme cytochrome c family protein
VFIGLPDMRTVMQMRLGWSLKTATGATFEQSAYFTPKALSAFDSEKEGFGKFTVDLTPRAAAAAANTPVTVDEGRRISELMGCVACHSNDGSLVGKVGPSWKGLFGSQRQIVGGGRVAADEAYLRESIKEPTARVVSGFEKNDTGMPSYEGVISESQIEALILYIKSVK